MLLIFFLSLKFMLFQLSSWSVFFKQFLVFHFPDRFKNPAVF